VDGKKGVRETGKTVAHPFALNQHCSPSVHLDRMTSRILFCPLWVDTVDKVACDGT
jgi:hypothetical protein